MKLSNFFTTSAFLAMSLIATAHAADKVPYDKGQFLKAQNENKPILVEITAPWCPTCKAQKPILEKLTSQPQFKELKIYEVDFDSKKDVLQELNVKMQSTLIVYKGKAEQGRSTGDTNETSISALINKSL